jgi:osmotically-inducible protein OsmY
MKFMFPLTLAAVVSTMLITSPPVRAADTDSRIESSAAKSYVFKTCLKDDSIKTESKDGVVTLTGTVAEASHKTLAENTVESLPGVKSVNNQLVVSGEQPAEHSDGWITTLSHHSTSALHTSVSTTDGVVTVGGVAKNEAEKNLVTKLATDINGVSSVINNMTIGEPMAAK